MTAAGLALCVYAAALLVSDFRRQSADPSVTRLVWQR